MLMKDETNLNGHLLLRYRNKSTGLVIDEGVVDDHNIITGKGASLLLDRLTTETGGSYVNTIFLGDDVGTGDLLDPETEKELYTKANQNIVYEVPVTDITITYPDLYTFALSTVLDGTLILDSLFPTEIDLRFTSATIRYADRDVLAYKRFPVRSLSRLVDIEITWTVSLREITQ